MATISDFRFDELGFGFAEFDESSSKGGVQQSLDEGTLSAERLSIITNALQKDGLDVHAINASELTPAEKAAAVVALMAQKLEGDGSPLERTAANIEELFSICCDRASHTYLECLSKDGSPFNGWENVKFRYFEDGTWAFYEKELDDWEKVKFGSFENGIWVFPEKVDDDDDDEKVVERFSFPKSKNNRGSLYGYDYSAASQWSPFSLRRALRAVADQVGLKDFEEPASSAFGCRLSGLRREIFLALKRALETATRRLEEDVAKLDAIDPLAEERQLPDLQLSQAKIDAVGSLLTEQQDSLPDVKNFPATLLELKREALDGLKEISEEEEGILCSVAEALRNTGECGIPGAVALGAGVGRRHFVLVSLFRVIETNRREDRSVAAFFSGRSFRQAVEGLLKNGTLDPYLRTLLDDVFGRNKYDFIAEALSSTLESVAADRSGLRVVTEESELLMSATSVRSITMDVNVEFEKLSVEQLRVLLRTAWEASSYGTTSAVSTMRRQSEEQNAGFSLASLIERLSHILETKIDGQFYESVCEALGPLQGLSCS